MQLYILEVESGSTDHGSAMVFDSVWSKPEKAKEYAREVYTGSFDYVITEVTLDAGF